MAKNLIASILAGVVLCTTLTTSVLSSADDFNWSDLVSGSNSSELSNAYTGTINDVVLPSEINGIKMKTVGEAVFKGNSSITSVVVPEEYTTLSGATFRGCSSLKSIQLPDTLTSLGSSNYVFRDCTSLKYINIPKNVKDLKNGSFYNCSNQDLVIDIQGSIDSLGNAKTFYGFCGTVKVRTQDNYDRIKLNFNANDIKANVVLVSGAEATTAGTTDAEPTTIEPTTIEPTTTEPTTAEVTTVEPTTVAPTTVEPTTVPSSKATVKFATQLGNWATPSQILYINESGSYSVELTNLNTNSFKNVGFFKYEPESGYTGEKCKITVDSIDITAQNGTVYNLKLSDMYLNRDPGASSDNGLPNVWNAAGQKAGVATSADGTAALDGGTGNGIEFKVDGTTTNFKALKLNLTVTLASDAAPTTAEPTTVEPTAPEGAVMGDLYYADADWFPQMHDYVVIDGDGTYTFNLSSSDGDSEGAIVFVLDFKDALTTNPDLKAELVSIDCNGTNMTIDQSKVKFGHLEQDKNNLRLEIYNYYGATKDDSPINQDSISFPKGATMAVTVKVSDFNGAATTAEPTTVEPTTVEPTTAEPTTAEPTTAEPVVRANIKFAAQLDNWSDLIQTIPIGENGDVSIDFTGLNANGFKNIGFFKYEPEKGYDGEKVLIDVTSIEITDGNGETYVMTLNDMNIDRDPGDGTGNGLPNIWNDAGKADVVASTADGTAKLIGAEDSDGYIAFLVNGDKAQVTGVKYNLTVKGLNEQSTTTDDPTEETTAAPDPTEETTVAPDPTEETTAADPTEATTSDTEPTTATDPDATTAEPTTAGNDAQTTTVSPATTKSAGTTVAASTTKAATTTKAASGTTTSTDKTVNTGAEAAVGLTIFMAVGIAGAVALKKRKR